MATMKFALLIAILFLLLPKTFVDLSFHLVQILDTSFEQTLVLILLKTCLLICYILFHFLFL